MNLSPRARQVLASIVAAVIAAAAGAGIVISATDDGNGGHTVTVRTPAASVPVAPPGDLNLREPLKTGPLTPTLLDTNRNNEAALLPPRPVGGAQTIECRKAYSHHLWSSRGGVKPTEFVVHYTAGLGTAENIDAYFGRTRAASATFILEPNGHCLQEVPLLEGKPWTQLNANAYSISVEIVTTGWNITRAQWLAMPIFRNALLASLMRESMRKAGIPLRRVDPVGCNFVAGYTDHNALECGNDHTDVLPNFPWDVLQRQLQDGGLLPITRTARRRCTELNRLRRRSSDYHRRYHLKPAKPLTKAQRHRAAVLRDKLRHPTQGAGTRYVCRVGPPHKRGSLKRVRLK